MLCLGLLCGDLSPFDSQNTEVSFKHRWEIKKDVVCFCTAVQWFGCLPMKEMSIISFHQLLSCLNLLLKRCFPLGNKSTVLVDLTVPIPTVRSVQ